MHQRRLESSRTEKALKDHRAKFRRFALYPADDSAIQVYDLNTLEQTADRLHEDRRTFLNNTDALISIEENINVLFNTLNDAMKELAEE